MTDIFITIDTEYSYALASRPRPASRQENFERSISCDTPDGKAGIFYKLDMFDRHGLKGVFFVDPMPALLWGIEAVEDIVRPIIERGHDIQLHCHTEWLALAGDRNPLYPGRVGLNIKDFTFDEQCTLLEFARDALVRAGAPAPIAFRAGNYGANDDTLLALAQIGLTHDTSLTPGIPSGHCAISLDMDTLHPVKHCGVIEVPTGVIGSVGSSFRHAQITALSAWEMLAAVEHARDNQLRSFTFVSHSFELMCRKRERINKLVRRRFEKLCTGLAGFEGIASGTYSACPPAAVERDEPRPVLPVNELRSGLRAMEQVVVNTLYGE